MISDLGLSRLCKSIMNLEFAINRYKKIVNKEI